MVLSLKLWSCRTTATCQDQLPAAVRLLEAGTLITGPIVLACRGMIQVSQHSRCASKNSQKQLSPCILSWNSTNFQRKRLYLCSILDCMERMFHRMALSWYLCSCQTTATCQDQLCAAVRLLEADTLITNMLGASRSHAVASSNHSTLSNGVPVTFVKNSGIVHAMELHHVPIEWSTWTTCQTHLFP